MAQEKNDWQLYTKLRRAEKDGIPAERLNAWAKKYSNGEHASYEALKQSLGIAGGGSKAVGAARTFMQGATLGAADEMVGLAQGALTAPGQGTFREGFTAGRERHNQSVEAFAGEHPKLATALEIIGAVPPSAMAAAMGGPGSLNATKGLLGRMGKSAYRMAKPAAAEGAAYGALSADGDVIDRAQAGLAGAVVGAGVGGLAGGAMVPIGQLATKFIPALKPGYAQRVAGEATADIVGRTGRSIDDIVRTMRQSGGELASVEPGMFNPFVRGARAMSEGGLDAIDGPVASIRNRQQGIGEAMVAATRKGAQVPLIPDPTVASKAMEGAWRRKFIKPLYRQYSTFGDPRLRKILKDHPEIAGYLPNAQAVRDAQKVGFGEAWDALNAMQTRIGGKIGPDERQNLIAATNAWENMMKTRMPEFAEASSVYSGIKGRWRSYETGKRLLNKSTREVQRAYDLAENKIGFRQGYLEAIEDAMFQNTGQTGGIVGRLLKSHNDTIDRMRFLFPDKNAHELWANRIRELGRQAAVGRTVAGDLPINPAFGGGTGLQAVITRAPSLINELISIVFEDPEMRRVVAEKVGRNLLEASPDEIAEILLRAKTDPSFLIMRPSVNLTAGQLGGAAGRATSPEQPGGLLSP